jgi:hypothetical protein
MQQQSLQQGQQQRQWLCNPTHQHRGSQQQCWHHQQLGQGQEMQSLWSQPRLLLLLLPALRAT